MNLTDLFAKHIPENIGALSDVFAGGADLLGRAAAGGGSILDASQRGMQALLQDVGITTPLTVANAPAELVGALERARAAGAGSMKPGQRLITGLQEAMNLSPEAIAAARKAQADAVAAAAAAEASKKNLAMLGLGAGGLLGGAYLLNRHSEDPEAYAPKMASELGWRPRGLLRQKVAAPFELSPAQFNQAMADTRAYVPGQSPRLLSGYDMSLRATPRQLNQVRMPSAAPSPAATPLPTAPRASVAPAAPAAPTVQRAAAPAAPAARAQRAPAAPRLQIPQGFSGEQLQRAAQMAAGNVQVRQGGRLAQADASRAGTRQFTEAQARQFLMRNPNAARAAFSSLQNPMGPPAPAAPAAPMTGGSQMWQQMVPGRVPAAPQVVPAPTMIGRTPINQVGGGGVGLLNAFSAR